MVDGVQLTDTPLALVTAGTFNNKAPVLLGSNRDEQAYVAFWLIFGRFCWLEWLCVPIHIYILGRGWRLLDPAPRFYDEYELFEMSVNEIYVLHLFAGIGPSRR